MIPNFNIDKIRKNLSLVNLTKLRLISGVLAKSENIRMQESPPEEKVLYLPYHSPSGYFSKNKVIGLDMMDRLSRLISEIESLGYTVEPDNVGYRNPEIHFELIQQLTSYTGDKNPITNQKDFKKNRWIKLNLKMIPVLVVRSNIIGIPLNEEAIIAIMEKHPTTVVVGTGFLDIITGPISGRTPDLWGSSNKSKSPSFLVESVEDGIDVMNHPDIVKNWKKSLRVKPKNRRAVLVPCAATKPFPESPSHKHGYLKALKGKNVDIYIVSEPLGIVPYRWSNTYPNNDYDFPPKYVKDEGRDLLVSRFRGWNEKVGRKYDKIYLALPGHHMKLVLQAGIQGEDASISNCRDNTCSADSFRATTQEYIDFLRNKVRG